MKAEHVLELFAIAAAVIAFGGILVAFLLRRWGLRWTWALAGIPAGAYLFGTDPPVLMTTWATTLVACVVGAVWHRDDLAEGADPSDQLGPVGLLRRWSERLAVRRDGWLKDGWLVVGHDANRMPVRVPVGYRSGSHTLVVGATGSGKTVTQAWIAGRLIDAGHAAVVVDPKGDPHLHAELQAAATLAGRPFLVWSPDGPLAYNPYGFGSATEVADKALAGEEWSEPHYLRQAQRYLGHAVRTMHEAGVLVSPVSLVDLLDPAQLEVIARQLPEVGASVVLAYLDSLTDRQKRDLAGVRDRLSILAESDVAPWLTPTGGTPVLELHRAVEERAVVVFRLDADRRQLVSRMLGAAIVSDLITLIGHLQREPTATVVVIDEFSAVAAGQVSRLFARARSAGVSLILGTQELADLRSVGDGGLREQVLGNVATIVAHRQTVPESAELIGEIAGTREVWVTTQQTEEKLLLSGPSGRGSRRRGHEFLIHPSQIKQLQTGVAVVITPGSGRPPAVAAMCHPGRA